MELNSLPNARFIRVAHVERVERNGGQRAVNLSQTHHGSSRIGKQGSTTSTSEQPVNSSVRAALEPILKRCPPYLVHGGASPPTLVPYAPTNPAVQACLPDLSYKFQAILFNIDARYPIATAVQP
ncbi:hypothetical protein ASE07_07250 [Noviherbaspirillum sp. Root189]|nr:hypothetical protein ASE07_07250 [Noviherbaspirillum sp. Root189]